MPKVPSNVKDVKEAGVVNLINAMRAGGTPTYHSIVPIANPSQESARQIGAIITGSPLLYNEFIDSLVNRIARVIVTSKFYRNPWEVFKKGLLETGETVEEIFVNLLRVHDFDPEVAERELQKRELPDVRAVYHVMNYQKFYKVTVTYAQLKSAFVSWSGVEDLITRIIDEMYVSANLDEFLSMKYLIARGILSGMFYPVEMPVITEDNTNTALSKFKAISNNLQFMKSTYNYAGVDTYTDKSSQILIMTGDIDAYVDVNSLAAAFNMDKAEFMGNRVMVDDFYDFGTRVEELFSGESWYQPFTKDEVEKLKSVQAVLVDADYFMIFDNLEETTSRFNEQGLYWNYWYHVWKTISSSPFANAIVFAPGESTVTSVTFDQDVVTVSAGQKAQLNAVVEVTGFADKSVLWSLTGNNDPHTTVSWTGAVTIGRNETASSVTVTATSKFDQTKKGTATVTIVS